MPWHTHMAFGDLEGRGMHDAWGPEAEKAERWPSTPARATTAVEPTAVHRHASSDNTIPGYSDKHQRNLHSSNLPIKLLGTATGSHTLLPSTTTWGPASAAHAAVGRLVHRHRGRRPVRKRGTRSRRGPSTTDEREESPPPGQRGRPCVCVNGPSCFAVLSMGLGGRR